MEVTVNNCIVGYLLTCPNEQTSPCDHFQTTHMGGLVIDLFMQECSSKTDL